jgi:hypothetical protein
VLNEWAWMAQVNTGLFGSTNFNSQ